MGKSRVPELFAVSVLDPSTRKEFSRIYFDTDEDLERHKDLICLMVFEIPNDEGKRVGGGLALLPMSPGLGSSM